MGSGKARQQAENTGHFPREGSANGNWFWEISKSFFTSGKDFAITDWVPTNEVLVAPRKSRRWNCFAWNLLFGWKVKVTHNSFLPRDEMRRPEGQFQCWNKYI